MKRFLIILTAAAAALAMPSCNKDDDEKAAIERFKADGKAIKEWTDKNKPDEKNPVSSMAMMDQMVVKLKAVRTDGLPADLKGAYGKMVAVVEKMQAAFKGFPKDQAAFMTFIQEKMTSDPAFMTNFQQQMETLSKEGDAASEELKTVAKKYGIEDLDIGPDKK
jgi:hypothetical protein